MPLRIETFSNSRGGNAFFKAVTHPLAAAAMPALLRRLARGPVAVYDPDGCADGLSDLYDFAALDLVGTFVQDVAAIGRPVLGRAALPVTELGESGARIVFVAAFEAQRLIDHIRHLLPAGAEVASLDDARLRDDLLSNPRRYLDPLNFATNYAFFRDAGGLHTRLVTANYWSGYGSGSVTGWMTLFGGDGEVLAEWSEGFGPSASAIILDSGEIRGRFRLPEFCGQLFLH